MNNNCVLSKNSLYLKEITHTLKHKRIKILK